tara:strand:+ start:40414 stop:40971 length:558 start_codon:yes stop_codon:yes gene_type:complete
VSKLILIGGGVRSGKSAFALQLARERGTKLAFIATAQAFDSEMEERIAAHKLERGAEFRTFEAPTKLASTLRASDSYQCVVVDCLTLWLSNLLLRGDSEESILAAIRDVIAVPRQCDLIIVTNEVGMGVVPESKLGRAFRDLAGRAHQLLASEADEIYAAMLGCMLRLSPGPVALVPQAVQGTPS